MEAISIFYRPEDYETTVEKVVGRISANESLLRSLVRYSRYQKFGIYLRQKKEFDVFLKQFPNQKSSPILYGDILGLRDIGHYFHTDPIISQMIWARSSFNPTAFNVCGLTHTVSHQDINVELSKLFLAPAQPWDALICTSHAAKKVITNLIDCWQDYFAAHNMRLQLPLQLPVISLGIVLEDMTPLNQIAEIKKNCRLDWQMHQDDFVIVFTGRLSFFNKANPIPMLQAIAMFAERVPVQKTIHLILAGRYMRPEDEAHFQHAIQAFAPHIKITIFDAMDAERRSQVLSAADVFISLVDNIQESFGLTPLEAMAHQLPVIVSDWDGYRDTVRHGIDGFRIPTTLPPTGCGADIGLGYLMYAINHDGYCGLTSQFTHIDIPACAEALYTLYANPTLRREMGEAGRKRIEANYDWPHIIQQYEGLWENLTEMRLQAAKTCKTFGPMPLAVDPLQIFQHYATTTLSGNSKLLANTDAILQLQKILDSKIAIFGEQQRLSADLIQQLLLMCREVKTVQQIVQAFTQSNAKLSSGVIVRTINYLLKYDLLLLKEGSRVMPDPAEAATSRDDMRITS